MGGLLQQPLWAVTTALVGDDWVHYSTRAIEIIEILFKQTDYMTATAISEQLKISKRTIFREMEAVEEILQAMQIEISKKTRIGIKVNATKEQKEHFRLMTQNQAGQVYSQEARQNLLMIELLKSREPKKLFYFADLLNVSEATISNDMDKIVEWFGQRKLELVRKPGYGVYVVGNEKSFRKAIVDYLYQTYEHEELVTLIQNDFFQTRAEQIEDASHQMLGLIDKEILLKVSLILKDYETMLEKRLAEGAYMGLMIHLAIAIQRILRGESIFMNSAVLDSLKGDEHFVTAREIARSIANIFGISVPDDEVGYITMHLKGSKLKTSAMVEEHDFIISNFELSRTTAKMIQKFRDLSGYDFRDDEKLLIGLASHLRPAITRMKLGLDIRNPLLQKIKEMYPEIYAMTQQATDLMTARYEVEVPEEEIGFLAMHFGAAIERFRKSQQSDKAVRVGVVCSSGIGTSSLLASRLYKLIPRIDVVGQFSKEDVLLGNLRSMNIECLISTIPLENSEYPTIIVNPLLVETDIERIKQMILLLSQELKPFNDTPYANSSNGIDRLKKIQELSSGILEVAAHFKVLELTSTESSKALIQHIAAAFTDNLSAQSVLENQLVEREKLGATILRNEGVKLLHTKTNEAAFLTFAVLRLEKPLMCEISGATGLTQSESVDLCILMLLPETASKHKMEIMSYLSKAMIEDTAFVGQLKTASEETLRQVIQHKLNAWFDSQIR